MKTNSSLPARLNVPQVPNQLDSIAPGQVARKFAIQETLVKQFKIMTDLCSHAVQHGPPHLWHRCIALLTFPGGVKLFDIEMKPDCQVCQVS